LKSRVTGFPAVELHECVVPAGSGAVPPVCPARALVRRGVDVSAFVVGAGILTISTGNRAVTGHEHDVVGTFAVATTFIGGTSTRSVGAGITVVARVSAVYIHPSAIGRRRAVVECVGPIAALIAASEHVFAGSSGCLSGGGGGGCGG